MSEEEFREYQDAYYIARIYKLTGKEYTPEMVRMKAYEILDLYLNFRDDLKDIRYEYLMSKADLLRDMDTLTKNGPLFTNDEGEVK